MLIILCSALRARFSFSALLFSLCSTYPIEQKNTDAIVANSARFKPKGY
jgi:hypothetical protein